MVTRHVAQGLSLRRRGRARGAGREGATVAKPTRRRARLNAGSARTAAIDNALQYDSKLPLRSWSDVARRRLSRALCAHALRCPRRSRSPLRPYAFAVSPTKSTALAPIRVCGVRDEVDRPCAHTRLRCPRRSRPPLRPYAFAVSPTESTALAPIRVCGVRDEVDRPCAHVFAASPTKPTVLSRVLCAHTFAVSPTKSTLISR